MGRLPRFDAGTAEVLDDPYATYARLRAGGPLCRGGPGQWVLTRHAEVSALLRDRRLSADYPEEYHRLSVGDGPAVSFFRRIVLDRDPPQHTRLRRLMADAFTPALVRGLTRRIDSLVEGLLTPAVGRGRLEVVAELALPLPVAVICELLGIPAADRDLVRPKIAELARGFALAVPPAQRAVAHDAVVWLRDYVGELSRHRRPEPGEDLLSTMLAAGEAGSEVSRPEIIDNAIFLFFAGFETTMNLIATGVDGLARHPAQWSRLRAAPELVAAAVEEFLRYDAPIQAAARMVTEPFELAGRTIRRGRLLVLLLGSANHDERRFADPQRLDIGRAPNPHVSFGGGTHHCLGAALARLEGRAVFGWLARHCAAVHPREAPTRRRSFTFRSFVRLPVSLTPP